MAADQPQSMRVGLRQRGASITLKLRWDRSPRICQAVVAQLPIENQVWHAKYANNEVYTLVPAFDDPPPREWLCAYPAPGDFLYIPITSGVLLPPGAPPMDGERGVIDLAYFYDRASSLLHGPSGPAIGCIFATATSIQDIERMAEACNDVWFGGAKGESLYLETA